MRLQWKWTIPNVLSLLRIGILPVFVVLYMQSCVQEDAKRRFIAFSLLVLSGVTDCLDGFIARRFHQQSEIGKWLDPIADKLTQVAVLVALTTQHSVFLSLVIISVVKELLQGLGGIFVLEKGLQMCSSKWYGKVSTALFYVVVATVLIWKTMPYWLILILVALVAVWMLFAFFRYLQLFLNIRKEVPPIEGVQTAEVEGSNGK